MNDLFNPEKGGIENLHGWMGQIVDESCWYQNHANKEFKHKLHLKQDVAGFGYRYKVRIFGRDTQLKDVADDQLEMAEVLLPVTAGSGHAGSSQTPNLRQGMYVWGFYKDGIDGTEPIIVGVLPNHSQTTLFGGDPDLGYTPRSGYYGKTRKLPVATKNLNIEGPGSIPTKENPQQQASVANYDQNLDGKRGHYLPKTYNCDGPKGELKGIQKVLKNILAVIKRIKKEGNAFLKAASNLTNDLKKLIGEVTTVLSGLIKSLFRKIRGFVVNTLNNITKDLFNLLPPNLRPTAADANQKATDTINCVFNKIISRLMKLVQQLLLDVIDKYVNAPLCAAESFLGNIISSVLGELTSGINSALNALSDVLGPIGDIADKIFDALDFITGILKFLSCDEDLNCEMNEEWSFWDGLKIDYDSLTGDFGNKLKEFASSGGGDSVPNCNSSQIPCGPPSLQSFGGGGFGLEGNVVVSVVGNIMGMDITNPGSGYNSPPKIQVADACGSGSGSVFEPIMVQETADTFTVSNVIVIDPGIGYLQSPDGSTGGDGYLFSSPCDTIINTTPYPPGQTIEVKAGQTIYLPQGTSVGVYNSSGSLVQTIRGSGQISGIRIERSGSITTPECANIDPTKKKINAGGLGEFTTNIPTLTKPSGISTFVNPSTGTYSVIPKIDRVVILNPGVNYGKNDTINITPNNGAELKPVFGDNGELTDVIIINKGNGFTDYPKITVESQTGVNAVIVPVFTFERIVTEQDVLNIPPGTSVINVIDCVGKIFQ